MTRGRGAHRKGKLLRLKVLLRLQRLELALQHEVDLQVGAVSLCLLVQLPRVGDGLREGAQLAEGHCRERAWQLVRAENDALVANGTGL